VKKSVAKGNACGGYSDRINIGRACPGVVGEGGGCKKGVDLVFRGCFMRKVAPGAICR